MLVLAVAAAVAVPAIGRGADTLRAQAQVAGFSAFLRYAHQQAITRRQVQEVHVDPDQHVMLLLRPGSDQVLSSRALSADLRVDATPPSALVVRFVPQGLSSGGSYRLETPGGRVFTVTVDPLTSRVVSRPGET